MLHSSVVCLCVTGCVYVVVCFGNGEEGLKRMGATAAQKQQLRNTSPSSDQQRKVKRSWFVHPNRDQQRMVSIQRVSSTPDAIKAEWSVGSMFLISQTQYTPNGQSVQALVTNNNMSQSYCFVRSRGLSFL